MGDRSEPLSMRAEQAKSCSSGLTDLVVGPTIHKMDADDWAALSPIESLPPVNSPEGRTPTPPTASQIFPTKEGESASPRPPTPERPLTEKDRIYLSLVLHADPEMQEDLEERCSLSEEIHSKKKLILPLLNGINGSVNGPILWNDLDMAGSAIQNGREYNPNKLELITASLQQNGIDCPYFAKFLMREWVPCLNQIWLA